MSYEQEENNQFVGSFPKDFGYGPFDQEEDQSEPIHGEQKPRILLMGLRRSGKSSIQKVVFHKMSPNETLFLESTNKIIKDDISNSSFVRFEIWDFPGQIDFFDSTFDSDLIFGGCGALVFVIDAQSSKNGSEELLGRVCTRQCPNKSNENYSKELFKRSLTQSDINCFVFQDDYIEALNKLHLTVTKAFKVNTNIIFEVFIHKVDGLTDDYKMEAQRDISQRANDDLIDAGYDNIHLRCHLTSIYDHSIFEAFSKVVQRLVPQLPTLENLLNIFISNSAIEKAFLFDVVSKIYIATDSAPVDMQSYELCCDMIDVVIDLSCIYGLPTTRPDKPEDAIETSAFDKASSSLIKLNNGNILYLREVNKFLALVCILREDNFDRQGVIDYNFLCFREAIQKVFDLRIIESGKEKASLPANGLNSVTSASVDN